MPRIGKPKETESRSIRVGSAGKKWGVTANDDRFEGEGEEYVLKLIVVMVAQL